MCNYVWPGVRVAAQRRAPWVKWPAARRARRACLPASTTVESWRKTVLGVWTIVRRVAEGDQLLAAWDGIVEVVEDELGLPVAPNATRLTHAAEPPLTR